MDRPTISENPYVGKSGRIHVTGTASEDADFDKRVHVLLLSPDHFGHAEVHEYAAVPVKRQEGLKFAPWVCFFRPPHHGRRFSLITALAVDDDTIPPKLYKAETDQYILGTNPDGTLKPPHCAGVQISIDGSEEKPREISYGDPVEVAGKCGALGAYGEGIVASTLIVPSLFWFEPGGTCHSEPPPPPPALKPPDPLTIPPFAPFPPKVPDPDEPGDGIWKYDFKLPEVKDRDPLMALFCATLITLDRTHRSVSAVLRLKFVNKKKGGRPRKHDHA
jgi:hypothetical protein